MVLATAGVAIGLGNIWRFPYMMKEYGGAAFLLVYLVIVFAIGIPALMAEWALGRHTRCGPHGAFTAVKMPGGRLVAGVLILTIMMTASYYGVVLAWVLSFALNHAVATVSSTPPMSIVTLTSSFGLQMNYVVITVFLACGVLMFGVRSGIERMSKIVMPLFVILFLVLIVRSLTLPGAMDGLKTYLVPSTDAFKPSTFLAAMGQVAFSIGLGGTIMVMYGSYMRREDAIPKAAVGTALADVGAALLAGMIIIPAALALQVELNERPDLLLFDVMPQVFTRMPAGYVFGSLFFFSIFMIALLSLIAPYEVLVDAGKRGFGWSRRTSLSIIFLTQVLLAIPALLISNYIGVSDLIWGTTMMPVGSVAAVLALAWCLGRIGTLQALSQSANVPFADFLIFWLRYVVPIAIVTMLVYGWWPTAMGWVRSSG